MLLAIPCSLINRNRTGAGWAHQSKDRAEPSHSFSLVLRPSHSKSPAAIPQTVSALWGFHVIGLALQQEIVWAQTGKPTRNSIEQTLFAAHTLRQNVFYKYTQCKVLRAHVIAHGMVQIQHQAFCARSDDAGDVVRAQVALLAVLGAWHIHFHHGGGKLRLQESNFLPRKPLNL